MPSIASAEVVIVRVRLRSWTGETPNTATDLGVSEENVTGIVKDLGASLLVDESHLKWQGKFRSRYDRLFMSHGIKTELGYAMPKTVFEQSVKGAADQLLAEYEANADSFVAKLPVYLKEQRDKHPAKAEMLTKRAPKQAVVRSKIGASLLVVPLLCRDDAPSYCQQTMSDIEQSLTPTLWEETDRAIEDWQGRQRAGVKADSVQMLVRSAKKLLGFEFLDPAAGKAGRYMLSTCNQALDWLDAAPAGSKFLDQIQEQRLTEMLVSIRKRQFPDSVVVFSPRPRPQMDLPIASAAAATVPSKPGRSGSRPLNW